MLIIVIEESKENRFETVLHNIALIELILRKFDQCFLEFKFRQRNPGVCLLVSTKSCFFFFWEKTYRSISPQQSVKQFIPQSPYLKVGLPNS